MCLKGTKQPGKVARMTSTASLNSILARAAVGIHDDEDDYDDLPDYAEKIHCYPSKLDCLHTPF